MAKKVDANQREIAAVIRSLGGRVCDIHTVGAGCPDLLVSCEHTRATFVIEVKSERGCQNNYELGWERSWYGHYYIIRTAEQAIRAYRLEDKVDG